MILYILEAIAAFIFMVNGVVEGEMFQFVMCFSVCMTFIVAAFQQSDIKSLKKRIEKLEKK